MLSCYGLKLQLVVIEKNQLHPHLPQRLNFNQVQSPYYAILYIN